MIIIITRTSINIIVSFFLFFFPCFPEGISMSTNAVLSPPPKGKHVSNVIDHELLKKVLIYKPVFGARGVFDTWNNIAKEVCIDIYRFLFYFYYKLFSNS